MTNEASKPVVSCVADIRLWRNRKTGVAAASLFDILMYIEGKKVSERRNMGSGIRNHALRLAEYGLRPDIQYMAGFKQHTPALVLPHGIANLEKTIQLFRFNAIRPLPMDPDRFNRVKAYFGDPFFANTCTHHAPSARYNSTGRSRNTNEM